MLLRPPRSCTGDPSESCTDDPHHATGNTTTIGTTGIIETIGTTGITETIGTTGIVETIGTTGIIETKKDPPQIGTPARSKIRRTPFRDWHTLFPSYCRAWKGLLSRVGTHGERGKNKRNATWRPVPKVKKLQEHDHKRNLDIYSLLTVIWHHSRNDLAAIATQPS